MCQPKAYWLFKQSILLCLAHLNKKCDDSDLNVMIQICALHLVSVHFMMCKVVPFFSFLADPYHKVLNLITIILSQKTIQ